uniref:Uncharacterized protein n=1 Tax=Falco tinnunculus TaxID=100819 RepID=A0A8C4ULH7_FALTI
MIDQVSDVLGHPGAHRCLWQFLKLRLSKVVIPSSRLGAPHLQAALLGAEGLTPPRGHSPPDNVIKPCNKYVVWPCHIT